MIAAITSMQLHSPLIVKQKVHLNALLPSLRSMSTPPLLFHHFTLRSNFGDSLLAFLDSAALPTCNL